MPFNRVIESLNIIQQLSDMPNEDDNLTADELKARFDKGVNILKEYVFSFIDELEGPVGADNIGYNGAQKTIGEALKALEAAGVGTIPPDGTITKEKLQDNSVTEEKLATDIVSKLNAVNVKFGEITPTYTGSSTTDEGASGYITENKWQEFDIGINAKTVILFRSGKIGNHYLATSSSSRTSMPHGLSFGEDYMVSTSSQDRTEYTRYGGIAQVDAPCKCGEYEVFKIENTKIKTHKITYSNTDNGNVDRYYIGTTDSLYYLALV